MTTPELWEEMVKWVPYAFCDPELPKEAETHMFEAGTVTHNPPKPPRRKLRLLPAISNSITKVEARLHREIEENKSFSLKPLVPRSSGPYALGESETFMALRSFNTLVHDKLYALAAESHHLKDKVMTFEEIKRWETSSTSMAKCCN